MEAMEPFRVGYTTPQEPAPLPYLVEEKESVYDIDLTVSLRTDLILILHCGMVFRTQANARLGKCLVAERAVGYVGVREHFFTKQLFALELRENRGTVVTAQPASVMFSFAVGLAVQVE